MSLTRKILLVVMFLSMPFRFAYGQDWTTQMEGIENKVPRIRMMKAEATSPGTCSGVFINATTGYVLTAAHCVDGTPPPHLTVAGREAQIVRVNRILDLAVLRVDPKGTDTTVLLAERTPPPGTPVAVAGYGFGSEVLFPQFGHIALPLKDKERSYINVDLLVGDSGGAVIDRNGNLVGITSAVLHMGPMHIGISVPIEVIWDYVKQYLP